MKHLQSNLTHLANTLGIPTSFEISNDALWASIEDTNALEEFAKGLHTMHARVCMITCARVDKGHDILYHFDIKGVLFNLKLHLKTPHLPSITPLFESANWAERELSELYGIALENHPNPAKLFIDESIKEAIYEAYVPLSSAMSGEVSRHLWEKVKMAQGENNG